MEVKYIRLQDLKPYENNPRNNDEAVQYVANSIKEFGFKVPIVIDKDNVIVTGHTRYKASQLLELEEVPCIIASDLSEEQVKAFRLADNKVGEIAEWDMDLLDFELDGIQDIDMTDFNFNIDLDIETEMKASNEKDDELFYFSKDEIQSYIVENWKKYNSVDEYVQNIIDIATAKYQYNRLCQGYNDGYNISLLFNPHRLNIETIKSKSIFYAINNDIKYAREFARYVVNVENKVLPSSQYYKQIGLGNAGYQYVNKFPPYLARDIYRKYCKDGYKILNPCAGWGGRIIGLSSLMLNDIEYIETEPSTKTYEGLLNLKKFLKLGDNYITYNKPFEELELKENYFDFVFTSPPYFNTEKYSNEETQSYIGKETYEQWKNDFLYVMLDKIYKSMKPMSCCLLNVGKVRYPIDTDIIEYMNKKYGVKCDRIKDFKYGGSGIGARTDELGQGEPFIQFVKKDDCCTLNYG